MDTQVSTGKPRLAFSTSLTSFEEEQRELLLGRCRLVFILGFVISVAVHFFYTSIIELHPKVDTAFVPWVGAVYDLYAVSTGLAAAAVFARRWRLRELFGIDYALITFNLLLSHFIAVVFDVNEVPAFGISLLLFVHAAFIPVPVASQVGLAMTAALGYPTIAALSYALIPEIHDFWLTNGGTTAFRTLIVEGTFQLAILGVASVLITKTLYHMRVSLHKAKRLGNYIIEGKLGSGGMGQVYIAQHALICRATAVKVLEAPPGESKEMLTRFEREVRLSAGLSHPNTITIYDYGRSGDNTFYYAMEYLEGMDLQQLVERFGPVTPERVVHILAQVCGSLAEAHDCNIIHRDVKPSNIFLTRCGGIYDFVKVLDFGLAKTIKSDEAPGITKTGMLLGTPRYISPETVSGGNDVDQRADLYCVGGVAYWMLAGHPPFDSASCIELIIQHVKATPIRPSETSELPVPPELDDIVMRCLEKRPEDRFQTATELAGALRAVRFESAWDQDRAREWWTLHAPECIGRSGQPAEPQG